MVAAVTSQIQAPPAGQMNLRGFPAPTKLEQPKGPGWRPDLQTLRQVGCNPPRSQQEVEEEENSEKNSDDGDGSNDGWAMFPTGWELRRFVMHEVDQLKEYCDGGEIVTRADWAKMMTAADTTVSARFIVLEQKIAQQQQDFLDWKRTVDLRLSAMSTSGERADFRLLESNQNLAAQVAHLQEQLNAQIQNSARQNAEFLRIIERFSQTLSASEAQKVVSEMRVARGSKASRTGWTKSRSRQPKKLQVP